MMIWMSENLHQQTEVVLMILALVTPSSTQCFELCGCFLKPNSEGYNLHITEVQHFLYKLKQCSVVIIISSLKCEDTQCLFLTWSTLVVVIYKECLNCFNLWLHRVKMGHFAFGGIGQRLESNAQLGVAACWCSRCDGQCCTDISWLSLFCFCSIHSSVSFLCPAVWFPNHSKPF